MAIVQAADFKGRFLIAQTTYNVGEIGDYIDRFTVLAIAELLGAELAVLFMDDVGGGTEPTEDRFEDFFGPFQIEYCGELFVSEGFKTYLMGIIYWWYHTENRVRPSAAGGVGQPKSENAFNGHLPPAEHYQRYNAAISTGRAIQAFIEKNISDYPEYNGKRLLFNIRM